MAPCKLIDYSERPASMIELYEYLAVTRNDIAELRDSIPLTHLERVEEGDFLVVYIVDNRVEGIIGLLTVLYNKTLACLDLGNGTVWGEWELDKELVVTAEPAEAHDRDGKPVRGVMAYNGHGVRGIYAQGLFYTMDEPAGNRSANKEEEMEPNYLCHDEENHEVHICQLKKMGTAVEIKNLAKDPTVSCLLCEAVAHSADNVCSPVELD